VGNEQSHLSFPTSAAFYDYNFNGEVSTFGALSASAQAAVRGGILPTFAAVANVTFTEVTETSSVHADLRYADSDATETAWAYYPSTGAWGGDVWVRKSGEYGTLYNSPVKGNYAWTTYLHETGHAMGLKHGHETNIYGALPLAHDSMEYSIMTYKSYVGGPTDGYTNETWGYAQTLMMLDVAALQYMYGANFNTNSSNSVYTWSATTGQMFINGVGQGAPGGNRIFMNVWDGGGADTFDFSNYTTNLQVNLNPGEWVNLGMQLADLDITAPGTHMARGNISNSLLYNGDTRSLIENAIGGNGNDTIVGNQANNWLTGGGGSDTLSGGAGDDTLVGGNGADWLLGGDGNDSLYGELSDLSLQGGVGSDTLYLPTGSALRGFDMVASSIEMIVTTENDNQVNVVLNVNGTIDEATNDTADTQTYTFYANHYMPDWTLYLQQFVDDNGD
jgi:serralysin